MATQQDSSDSLIALSVVWYKVLPARFGGQKGTAVFNEHLGRLMNLTCLCASSNEKLSASYAIDNSLPTTKIQFVNPFCWRKIFLATKRTNATHLILEFPYHGIAGMICKRWLKQKLIVHSHNIEYLRFRQQKKWWWQCLFLLEKATLRSADLVFFKTESDRTEAINAFQLLPKRTQLLPYGVERKDYYDQRKAKEIIRARHGLSPDTKLLLFAGTLDYEPNAKAVVNIHQILLPLLNQKEINYKVIICGRIIFSQYDYLKALMTKQMIYAGDVDDIDNYFAAADAFLNPVLGGGGVQTKIVDALSFHLNVICFESAAQGIEHAKEKLFLSPDGDWTILAEKTAEALKPSQPTSPYFFDRYNWDKLAKQVFAALQSV